MNLPGPYSPFPPTNRTWTNPHYLQPHLLNSDPQIQCLESLSKIAYLNFFLTTVTTTVNFRQPTRAIPGWYVCPIADSNMSLSRTSSTSIDDTYVVAPQKPTALFSKWGRGRPRKKTRVSCQRKVPARNARDVTSVPTEKPQSLKLRGIN